MASTDLPPLGQKNKKRYSRHKVGAGWSTKGHQVSLTWRLILYSAKQFGEGAGES